MDDTICGRVHQEKGRRHRLLYGISHLSKGKALPGRYYKYIQAILGGACVDTGENLGPPLTPLIDTFVSVAGANHGSFLCAIPFPGACNMINGMSCTSSFIRDINARPHYEATFVFSIYSPQDDKVGYRNACGQLCSQIAGANAEYVVGGRYGRE